MAAEKKKPPPKKKTPEKKKNGDKSKNKSDSEKDALHSTLLKICYIIAISDLLHSLYFSVQAMMLMVKKFSVFAMLAVLGVIFWVIIVIMLLVGLCKRKPGLVRFWIIFSLAGFITDIIFLLWGLATSLTVDWDRLREFSIIFLGIFIESCCLFFIHRYYKVMGEKPKEKRTLCCGGGNNDKKNKNNKNSKKKKGKK
ncbi:uncharacterized protein LOC119554201 [Drosophila subpulchrella]|uniref:uncharacterized protein LOC119554201 n=1 Tax=Drosophila subpulchrella TaxID=1486046 RepID=UPI0018A157BA|nr:uncharacterized protein LOC119554201 [Drosophila subpulchrella]